jgi:hypothetical protein
MIYQISYELRTQDKDYSSLFSYIEHNVGKESKHVLRDVWWFSADSEIEVDKICDILHELMGEKDIFYVSKVPEQKVNGWLPSQHWEWYTQNK